MNQLVVTGLLEKLGHEVASDGVEAVEAVEHGHFDLVLMDAHMPNLDGIGATQAIRALRGPRSTTPIIALTANAMAGDREVYLAAGMDGYATKPVEQDALLDAIRRVLKRR